MSSTSHVDAEFRSLLLDFLKYGVFLDRSEESRVVALVASKGINSLASEQRMIWERGVLPVISKPLHEQVVVASVRRAGR